MLRRERYLLQELSRSLLLLLQPDLHGLQFRLHFLLSLGRRLPLLIQFMSGEKAINKDTRTGTTKSFSLRRPPSFLIHRPTELMAPPDFRRRPLIYRLLSRSACSSALASSSSPHLSSYFLCCVESCCCIWATCRRCVSSSARALQLWGSKRRMGFIPPPFGQDHGGRRHAAVTCSLCACSSWWAWLTCSFCLSRSSCAPSSSCSKRLLSLSEELSAAAAAAPRVGKQGTREAAGITLKTK